MPDNEGKSIEKNTQEVPADVNNTDNAANLRESLRVQKTEFIKAQMQRQREAEDGSLTKN